MASLIVRNVDAAIVMALKASAKLKGISVEAEHRKILAEVLLKPTKRGFVEAITSIPNVGNDYDFERAQDGSANNVFN